MKKGKDGFYCLYMKRFLDVICALCTMIVFCWLYAIVAVLIRIKLGSPVIFKQQRPGKDEKLFTLHKFRTMTDAVDKDGKLLPDDMRLTKFGKVLRSTSLDELPEAWNILKGDMSVVGPRPLLIQYLPLYDGRQRLRHKVRPGLSGLAQISGRNGISWEEKFNLDIEYVNSVTFLGDCKLILITLWKAIKREGINSDSSATMEEFKGYLKKVDI